MTSSDPALDVRSEHAGDVGAASGAAPADDLRSARSAEPVEPARPGPGRRRRRTSKWDRPPPRDWRWWIAKLGATLIAAGLLMFAFVAYQLWGTGIETARAQRSLEGDFETLLAEATPGTADTAERAPSPGAGEGRSATAEPTERSSGDPDRPATDRSSGDPERAAPDRPARAGDGAHDPATGDGGTGEPTAGGAMAPVPVEAQQLPEIAEGDALARLEIPRIGVDHIVVAGVSTEDLRKGPGHYPDTPLPGQLGNAAIAGHRTTYGQPFYDVDELEPGDEMIVTTPAGRFVYLVTGQQIVAPSDYEVVATVDPTVANLTLTSCHPRFTARERIVVSGELDPGRSSPVGEALVDYGRGPDAGPGTATEAATGDVGTARPATSVATSPGAPTAPGGQDGAGGEDDGRVAGADASTGADRRPGPEAAGAPAGDAGAAPVAAGAASGTELADAFAEGWFSDPGAPPQVALWGLVVALVALGAYLLSRTTRRDWVGGLVGIVPFVIALYFFFQNVNRLLPPNL